MLVSGPYRDYMHAQKDASALSIGTAMAHPDCMNIRAVWHEHCPHMPRIALGWSLGDGDGDLRAVELRWWSRGRCMMRLVNRSAAGLAPKRTPASG
jgi:hypothetical protein